MMKKAPIGGLVYQEYYLSRTYIRNNIFIALAFSATMLLALGSFRYGNLRLLSEEIRGIFWDYFLMLGKYGPIFAICSIPESCMDASIRQEHAGWKRFRLTLPVSGFCLAAARYLFLAIITAFSALLAAVYFLIFHRIYPGEISVGCIGLGLIMFAVLHLFATAMSVFGILFGSADKAGICSCVLFLALFLLLYVLCPNLLPERSPDIGALLYLEKWGAEMIPFAAALILISSLGGFFATGCLFQRRER